MIIILIQNFKVLLPLKNYSEKNEQSVNFIYFYVFKGVVVLSEKKERNYHNDKYFALFDFILHFFIFVLSTKF